MKRTVLIGLAAAPILLAWTPERASGQATSIEAPHIGKAVRRNSRKIPSGRNFPPNGGWVLDPL